MPNVLLDSILIKKLFQRFLVVYFYDFSNQNLKKKSFSPSLLTIFVLCLAENSPKTATIQNKLQFDFESAPVPMEIETISSAQENKTVEKLMEDQIEQLKIETRRRNSYKQAAQNYEQLDIESDSKLYSRAKRNSDVGGVMSDSKLHSQRAKENRRSFRRKLDVKEEKVERTSPKRRAERGPTSSPEAETESPRPKQR